MSLDVLVTGGSGYLGQFLLHRLAALRSGGGRAADAGADAADAPAPPTLNPRPLPPLVRRLAYTYLANPLPAGGIIHPSIRGFRVDLADSPDGGRAALLEALEKGLGLGSDEGGRGRAAAGRRTIIINCVAISTPAACERDYERARRVNVPEALTWAAAEAAARAEAKAAAAGSDPLTADTPSCLPAIIHLSTDQVYPGEGRGMWRDRGGGNGGQGEGDPLLPENAYGRSKLEAERHLAQSWPRGRHASLRASLIYGPQAPIAPVPRPLFVQFVAGKLLEAAEAAAAAGAVGADGAAAEAALPPPVEFFEDEFRSAVLAEDIAEAVERMLRGIAAEAEAVAGAEAATAAGVQSALAATAAAAQRPSCLWPLPLHAYNMGGPERLSRVDMARLVARALGLDGGGRGQGGDGGVAAHAILPVPSASVPADVRGYTSPRDISMDSSAVERDVGVTLTRMQDALPRVLAEEARAAAAALASGQEGGAAATARS
jgi:dTDP-4-dehydrorhamnose reductase